MHGTQLATQNSIRLGGVARRTAGETGERSEGSGKARRPSRVEKRSPADEELALERHQQRCHRQCEAQNQKYRGGGGGTMAQLVEYSAIAITGLVIEKPGQPGLRVGDSKSRWRHIRRTFNSRRSGARMKSRLNHTRRKNDFRWMRKRV